MKKKYKILYTVLTMVLLGCVTLVSASLLGFFEPNIQAKIDVKSPITIDGKSSGTIFHNFTGIGGCCYCFQNQLCNIGCEGIWLDWQHEGDPDLVGIDIIICEKPICATGLELPTGIPCPCSCDCEPIDLPFYLDDGECIDICFCYELDVLIKPDTYTVISKLIPSVI